MSGGKREGWKASNMRALQPSPLHASASAGIKKATEFSLGGFLLHVN